MLQHSPLDQLKIKYNKAWLNTNVAKTQAFLEELVFHPSPLCGEGRKTNSPKNACVGGYQNTDWETYCFNSWEFHLQLHSYSSLAKTWLSIRNRIYFSRGHTVYGFWVFFCFLSESVDCERKSLDFKGRTWNGGKCGAIHTKAYFGSITSRCSGNEPALLLLLGRTEKAAEIEPGWCRQPTNTVLFS